MQSRIAPFIGISVVLALLAWAASAQATPAVTITPAAGEVESAVFIIEIDGLQPDARHTVEIVFEGQVVFSSEEKSDQAGHIPYPISSTAGDLPGMYTLRALYDGEVIASGEFTLTAAEPASADGEILGDVSVSPETAPFGKAQALRIANLEANAAYTVEITARETFEVAYRRQHTSDAAGVIDITIFAEEGDAAGLQSIAVYDEAGALIAAGIFTILPLPERDVRVALSPNAIEAGANFALTVSGLAAFDSVTAQITGADQLLMDTLLARASSDGVAAFSYVTPATIADGAYTVAIFVEGDELARTTLHIGAAPAPESTLTIQPPQAPIGARHQITVAGLSADQRVTLLVRDPAGAEEYRALRLADARGMLEVTLSSSDEDDAGLYAVEILAEPGGELLARASFEITAADEPERPSAPPREAIATIAPQSAAIGSSHVVSVRNLAANEAVTFNVVYAGALVYTSDKTADAAGVATLELVTGDGDRPGDYRVTIARASGNQPSVTLTATAPPVMRSAAADTLEIRGRLIDGAADVKFDGVGGQFVVIRVASREFDPAAALIDRGNARLARSDDSRGLKDAIIGPLALPYSGEYSLAISAAPLMMPQGAETGEFSVTIEPADLVPIPFDAAVDFTLSEAAPALYYRLPVQTGDSLTISVDSMGALDTLLQLVSPAGEEYAFDDDSGTGLDAELSNLIFDRDAAYVLVISSFDRGASGSGAFTVARNLVQSLDEGAARITLNDKATRDLVVFDAQRDELLTLNLDVVAGDVEDLFVTATIDGMEVMSYSTMGVPAQLPLAFVTPMSGTVVVTLEKLGFDDGIALKVSLERG